MAWVVDTKQNEMTSWGLGDLSLKDKSPNVIRIGQCFPVNNISVEIVEQFLIIWTSVFLCCFPPEFQCNIRDVV